MFPSCVCLVSTLECKCSLKLLAQVQAAIVKEMRKTCPVYILALYISMCTHAYLQVCMYIFIHIIIIYNMTSYICPAAYKFIIGNYVCN